MGLSHHDRMDNTTEELMDHLESRDAPEWKAEMALGISQILFKDAYENGTTDSTAVAFTEDVSKPLVQYAVGSEDAPEIDVSYWRQEVKHVPGKNKSLNISPKASKYAEKNRLRAYREEIEDVVEPDAFHTAVGIWSSGIAPLYTATDYIDADEIIVAHSSKLDSDEVEITETMDERADFDGQDVIIIDDYVDDGETLRAVGDYLDQQGAENVYAAPVWTHTYWEVSGDAELIERQEDGSYILEG